MRKVALRLLDDTLGMWLVGPESQSPLPNTLKRGLDGGCGCEGTASSQNSVQLACMILHLRVSFANAQSMCDEKDLQRRSDDSGDTGKHTKARKE
jgi:hypothetical protein